MSGSLPDDQVIALALEAISDGDGERLRSLLDPGVRIGIGPNTHEGADAALAWVGKRYDHLVRRYVLNRLDAVGAGYLGSGRVEYVWRERGDVGDSTPVFFGFEVSGGLLQRLSVHDDVAAARASLAG